MKLKISLFVFMVSLISCKEKKRSIESKIEKINYLIEVDELLKIYNHSTIKILDFRKPKFYTAEHIIGAVNIWRTDIENSAYPYGGMMASKEQIEHLFSNLGINTKDTIVIYDNNGLCDSARLWWILHYYGFTNVKLLHGGIDEWKLNKGKISNERSKVKKTTFKLPDIAPEKYFVSKDKVLEALNTNTIIIDTRTDDEYSGKRQKNGAFKGGRILNSTSIDWCKAIDYNGDKKFKSITDLTKIYSDFISKQDTIIVYCHSGVRSAHTTFVLTQLLGYENVLNYDGSWIEWSYFDNLPTEADSITTIIK